MQTPFSSTRKSATLLALAGAVALLTAGPAYADFTIKPYFEFKKPRQISLDGDISLDTNGKSAPYFGAAGATYVFGFEGISQYDGATLNRNFIPPDTMGAVGRTQYLETSNGAFGVFDKSTGTRLSLTADVAFWAAAGQTGANGDTRVLYNAAAGRWVVAAFGGNTKDIQIAISDTDNALGTWKSVKYEGYAGLGFGATADYPTLAMDTNAIYIGTNNFAPATSGGANSFRGTTLNVIPVNSLFNPGAPSLAGFQQFTTPYVSGGPGEIDRGFAQQGINSRTPRSSGTVVAASLSDFDIVGFKINGLTPNSAAGATLSAPTGLGETAYTSPGAARQPAAAVAANRRVVDAGDERISSASYEAGGRIYTLHTVDTTADGVDEARVRYLVLDSSTLAILDQGDIGTFGYDSYQGSIAVNSFGQVVVGYNRSGLDAATGKISFMARTFNTAADGKLVATSNEILLKESLTDDYHNGSLIGAASVGRQRWGDYSAVSLDPSDEQSFYLIGEFAREYNNAAGGHPGGTGASRWGTWVAVLNVTAVPEPSTYLLMLFGFGVVGATALRRRAAQLH
ncbi:MAG: PEP-CTERM sorting domain-containing protein [Rubrivivax sp.]